MGSTRPMWVWVGLNLCDGLGWVGLGWVEFFLTHHGGLGQKFPSTRPIHTPTCRTFFGITETCNCHTTCRYHSSLLYTFILNRGKKKRKKGKKTRLYV